MTNTVSTYELLKQSAVSSLDLQRDDGSFPAGRNGVYDEQETPLRTTSKWLIVLAKAYDLTGHDEFFEAANAAADYLLSDDLRPHGYTYHSRTALKKDKCDGVVGQASPIRGLAYSGKILDRSEMLETAREIFFLHPYDEDLGLWEKVEIDGTYLSFDRTLNHQITFAAASAQLKDTYPSVEQRIRSFLDVLNENVELHEDGLIKHYARPKFRNVVQKVYREPRHWPLILNEMVFHYYSRSQKRRVKEIGYHPVNIRSLGKLKMEFPNHPLWKSKKIDYMVEFVHSDTYPSPATDTEVRYGAIMIGTATALALVAIEKCDVNKVEEWIRWDVEKHYNYDEDLFTANVSDSNTSAASIYNFAHLPDVELDIQGQPSHEE